MIHKRNTHPRGGFTLIELLVVFAIIAILASLLLAAVFKTLSAGRDLNNRQDIANLHQAVAAFKNHFGLEYMPSQITLAQTGAAIPDQASKSYLSRMFPNKGFADKFFGGAGVTWNDQAAGAVTLQGQECLVFFLGGPQKGGQPIGWSVNPDDPADPTGDRKIFYEFRKSTLKPMPGRQYLSYYDPWNQEPYGYFSITGSAPNSYQQGDCSSLGPPFGTLAPYGAPGSYYNPNSYQILSAGKDGKWGVRGTAWNANTAPQIYPQGSPGADDLSNFHPAKMGAAP